MTGFVSMRGHLLWTLSASLSHRSAASVPPLIEGVGDSFRYVFNEQITNPDGTCGVDATERDVVLFLGDGRIAPILYVPGLITDFAQVVGPVASGPGRPLGWHQTSYKRELVLARGTRLGGLTVVVYLATFPLTAKSMRSMAAMSKRKFIAMTMAMLLLNLVRGGAGWRASGSQSRPRSPAAGSRCGTQPALRAVSLGRREPALRSPWSRAQRGAP